MTISEETQVLYSDEKRSITTPVRSWIISGTELPHEKNLPVRLSLSGCAPIYMLCQHQGSDVFLAFPISAKMFLRLKWRRLWRFLGRSH